MTIPLSIALALAASVATASTEPPADPYAAVEATRQQLLSGLALPMTAMRALYALDTLDTPEAPASAKPYREAVDALRKARWHSLGRRLIHVGLWMRPYRSDLSNGHLFEVLDHAADLGVTDLFVESFWGGKLVESVPSKVFPSRYPGYPLLSAYVLEGHRRGLKVHAWLHPLDFGPDLLREHPDWRALDGQGRASSEAEPGLDMADPGVGAVRDRLATLIADLSHVADGVVLDDVRYPASRVDGGPDPRHLWGYQPATLEAFWKEHKEFDTMLGRAFLAPIGDMPGPVRVAPQPAEYATWKDFLTDRLGGLVRVLRDRATVPVALAYDPEGDRQPNDTRLEDANRWLGLCSAAMPKCLAYPLDPLPGPGGETSIARQVSEAEASLATMGDPHSRPALIPVLTQDAPDTPLTAPAHHRSFREQIAWLRGSMLDGRFPSIRGLVYWGYDRLFPRSEAERKTDDAR
jgi:hypothetical protein